MPVTDLSRSVAPVTGASSGIVTRPRRVALDEVRVRPTDQEQ